MAPPLSALYTSTFFLALTITLFIAGTLRLLAILPHGPFRQRPLGRHPIATRVLIILGSGGHTHEMFYLLKDLDTRKYAHRTYVVSSGDAFSSQRAVEFERRLEEREKEKEETERKFAVENRRREKKGGRKSTGIEERLPCVGPNHYTITLLPRARQVHQTLLTTPFTSLYTLLSSFTPLLSPPLPLPNNPPTTPHEAAVQDLPGLIIANGPGTAVIVILASLILRFFNIKGANSRGKCKTVYVESFARVTSLSLSGKLLWRVVDRFIVQWEELEGRAGRAEFWGVLV